MSLEDIHFVVYSYRNDLTELHSENVQSIHHKTTQAEYDGY